MRRLVPTVALAIVAAIVSPAVAQQQPAFDVASVKRSDPSASIGMYREGGKFIATNVTLRMLVGFAYEMRDYQVIGGPPWADRDRFTIEATMPSSVTPLAPQSAEGRHQTAALLQELLRERFQLRVSPGTHVETAYDLTVASGGPRLKVSTESAQRLRGGRGTIEGVGARLPALAQLLSQQLGRVVTDATSLADKYDFTLTFDPASAVGNASGPPSGTLPSIFTALEEQLGLRLRAVERPVPTVTIEDARPPDAN